MLTAMVALLISQGHADIAKGIQLAQGSYRPWSKFSANTHAGCGVIDISRFNSVTGRMWTAGEWNIIVAAARQVGFAAWHRTAIKDLWVEHAHLVAVGCPDLNKPDATDQVTEYRQGYDGLQGNARDNGPRNWVNVTWETYSAAKAAADAAAAIKPKLEDDMPIYMQTTGEVDPATGKPWNPIYALVPGKPVYHLSPEEWGYLDRLQLAKTPGSPFLKAQVDVVNRIIQPDPITVGVAALDPAAIAAAIPSDIAQKVVDAISKMHLTV